MSQASWSLLYSTPGVVNAAHTIKAHRTVTHAPSTLIDTYSAPSASAMSNNQSLPMNGESGMDRADLHLATAMAASTAKKETVLTAKKEMVLTAKKRDDKKGDGFDGKERRLL